MKYLLILLIILTTSCGNHSDNRSKYDPEKITTVVILHTNDTHGALAYFPKLKTVADQIRPDVDKLLIISGGDIFSGDPFTDQYHDPGYPMIDLMNRTGYDLTVVGNHDFDYGQQVLQKRLEQANFPLLLANLIDRTPEIEKMIDQYLMTLDNSIILNFVGLLETSSNGTPSTALDNIIGITFNDPATTFERYKTATDQSALILLSHMGVKDDRKHAEKFPETDLIIGGHSHTKIFTPELVNGVMITQAGGKGYYVGKITLTFKGNQLINKSGKLIQLNDTIADDPEIKKVVDQYYSDQQLRQPIGTAGADFSGKQTLGNLITTAYQMELDTNFAIVNNGGIRYSWIEAGEIQQHHIYQIDPFNNEMVILPITHPQLETIILDHFNGKNLSIALAGLHLLLDQINCDQDGIGEIVRKTLVDHNQNPVDTTKSYTMAVSKYLADQMAQIHIDNMVPTQYRSSETLINYIEEQETIYPDNSSDIIRRCQ